MNQSKLSVIACAVVSIAGFACAHGQPQKDKQSAAAKEHGYFVSSENAKARGGNAGYVSRICSDGGWGMPSKNCTLENNDQIKTSAAAPVARHVPKAAAYEVYFETNKTDLTGEQASRLKKWIDETVEARNDRLSLSVKGFADARGDANYNASLSDRRAKSVLSAIQNEGVQAKSIATKGEGEVAGSDSSMEQANKARRVEIYIE